MKIESQQLLKDLCLLANEHLSMATRLLELPEATLNDKPTPESWSTLECLEHMNLYGDFYLPEMRKQIRKSKSLPTATYKPGWFGNWFANMMQPKDKLNKMKTFKSKDPAGSQLGKEVVQRFIDQQKELLLILNEAEKVNLGGIRVPMTIPLIKVKLGDTLRFFINHNERHRQQVQRILQAVGQGASVGVPN